MTTINSNTFTSNSIIANPDTSNLVTDQHSHAPDTPISLHPNVTHVSSDAEEVIATLPFDFNHPSNDTETLGYFVQSLRSKLTNSSTSLPSTPADNNSLNFLTSLMVKILVYFTTKLSPIAKVKIGPKMIIA